MRRQSLSKQAVAIRRADAALRAYKHLRYGPRCNWCRCNPGSEVAHITGRSNLQLRWSDDNTLLLCHPCHAMLHHIGMDRVLLLIKDRIPTLYWAWELAREAAREKPVNMLPSVIDEIAEKLERYVAKRNKVVEL